MKKIIKRIPAQTVVSYQCGRCRAKYPNEKKALECNAMDIEKKAFRIGDRVVWFEERFCQNRQKHYWMHGTVRKILGPTLPDEEYNIKWLGNMLSSMHVYMYEVSWRCPLCKEFRDGRFYSPELRKGKYWPKIKKIKNRS